MIETTINQVLNSVEVLNDLVSRPLKAKTAYHVARLVREVNNESKLFEEERVKLVEKYAERDDKGEVKTNDDGGFQVAQENFESYAKEINELVETTIQLNVEPLNIDDFADENFTPQQMENLSIFLQA